MFVCKKCGEIEANEIRLETSGPHVKVMCGVCGTYIKMSNKRERAVLTPSEASVAQGPEFPFLPSNTEHVFVPSTKKSYDKIGGQWVVVSRMGTPSLWENKRKIKSSFVMRHEGVLYNYVVRD